MVHGTATKEIQKSYKQNFKQPTKNFFQSLFFSSLISAVFAVTLSLLLVIPIVRQELSGQQALLAGRLSSVEPVNRTSTVTAADPNAWGLCEMPSGSVGGVRGAALGKPASQVVRVNPVSPSNGGRGGGNIVERFLSENNTSNQATIRNTGAYSTNKIAQVTKNITTVTNTNTLSASVDNPQVAKSGSVLSAKNTTVGTSSSGKALNNSDVSLMFSVKQ